MKKYLPYLPIAPYSPWQPCQRVCHDNGVIMNGRPLFSLLSFSSLDSFDVRKCRQHWQMMMPSPITIIDICLQFTSITSVWILLQSMQAWWKCCPKHDHEAESATALTALALLSHHDSYSTTTAILLEQQRWQPAIDNKYWCNNSDNSGGSTSTN